MTGQNATCHGTTNWILPESNNRNEFGPADWNWKGITRSDVTLPRMLKEGGYKTIHVGKAHFGCNDSEGANPLHVGFDVNIAGSAIGHPGSYYGEDGYGNTKGDKRRAVTGLEKYHGTDTFFLSVARVKNTKEHIIDGYNLKAQLTGKPSAKRPESFLMHFPHQHNSSYFTSYRDGDWKVIYEYCPETPDAPTYQLYNLKSDFIESQNLADKEKKILSNMMMKMVKQLEYEHALYPQDKEGNPLKPIVPRM